MTTASALPPVVSADEWQVARDELLADEKEATRLLDRIAARRRRLPMVRFGDYTFATPDGPRTLVELFQGRDRLLAYQFMDIGPDAFCGGCTAFTQNVPAGGLQTLADAGVSWITVSDMPLEQLAGYGERMGWTLPIASSRGTTFSTDVGAGGGFMFSAFVRDGDTVYRTYSTTQRGVDRLLFSNSVLDLTVWGREEDWEDSPAGWPQHPTYG